MMYLPPRAMMWPRFILTLSPEARGHWLAFHQSNAGRWIGVARSMGLGSRRVIAWIISCRWHAATITCWLSPASEVTSEQGRVRCFSSTATCSDDALPCHIAARKTHSLTIICSAQIFPCGHGRNRWCTTKQLFSFSGGRTSTRHYSDGRKKRYR